MSKIIAYRNRLNPENTITLNQYHLLLLSEQTAWEPVYDKENVPVTNNNEDEDDGAGKWNPLSTVLLADDMLLNESLIDNSFDSNTTDSSSDNSFGDFGGGDGGGAGAGDTW